MALETALQLAITVYLCLAVKGSRGSTAAGGGGLSLPRFWSVEDDSLLSSHPMFSAALCHTFINKCSFNFLQFGPRAFDTNSASPSTARRVREFPLGTFH